MERPRFVNPNSSSAPFWDKAEFPATGGRTENPRNGWGASESDLRHVSRGRLPTQMHPLSLLSLRVTPLRFRLETLGPFRVPEYKGALFRGGFGQFFRDLVCITRRRCARDARILRGAHTRWFSRRRFSPTHSRSCVSTRMRRIRL